MPAIDMTGERYGRLIVMSFAGLTKYGTAKWNVLCDCGNTKSVERQSLKSGRTRSCGCLAREAGIANAPLAHAAAISHGQATACNGKPTKLYCAWIAMKNRCHTKTAGNYERYGGRGVKVCDEWLTNFEVFAAHVGEPPSAIHSLDRINTLGDYEPGNVRWATPKEQANNRRNNRRK